MLLTVYGPVPTASGLVNFSGPDSFDQMCSGTILVSAIWESVGTAGSLKVNVTSVSLVAVTLESFVHSPFRSKPGFSLKRLNVYATSLALNGLPSDHFTPV